MDEVIEKAVKDETKTLNRMTLGSPFNQKLFKNVHALFKSDRSKKSNNEIHTQKQQQLSVNDFSTNNSPILELESAESSTYKTSPLTLTVNSDDMTLSPSLTSPTSNRKQKVSRFGATSPITPRKLSIPQRKNSLGLHRTESFKKKDTKKLLRNTSLQRFNSMYANDKDLNLVYSPSCISSLSVEKDNSKLSISNIPTYQLDESQRSSKKNSGKGYKSITDKFPRISVDTLKDIMISDIHKPHFDEYLVIDCRFSYEYNGGHIRDAFNCSIQDDLETELIFNKMADDSINKSYLLIFHCEFSNHRCPTLASSLRNQDRIINNDNYPHLFYPDIVILDGGYKEFYNHYSSLCYPINYVEMDSKENLIDCEIQLDRFRKDSKKVISRSNSLRKFNSFTSVSTNNSSLNFSNSRTWKESRILEEQDTNIFRPEPPPRLFYKHLNSSRRSSSNISCDDNFSSLTSTSSNSNTGKIMMSDTISNDPYFSFEENDEEKLYLEDCKNLPSKGLPFSQVEENEIN